MTACDSDDGGTLAARPPIFVAGLELRDAAGTSKSVFQVGEPVTLVMPVTNVTDQPQRMNLPTAQTYDFVVRDLFGKPVWRWSSGRSFPAVVTVVDFQPGETKVFSEVWTQVDDAGRQVAADRYLVQGLTDLGRTFPTRSPIEACTVQ